MENITARLREVERTKTWVEHLERIGPPACEIVLPPADEVPPVLVKLAIPHEEIDGIVAMMPDREGSPEVWWLLERCAHALIRTMGEVDDSPAFPALPEAMGIVPRYFYVFVFLATLPHVRAYHRAREIPDDVSWLTLADLGRNMAVHRGRYGTGGLHVPFWLMLHFGGTIYDLGRLQFERAKLGKRTGQAIQAAGLPFGPGAPALSVHIPEFSGPLSPRACDASFARATDFFARHFPEERYQIAVCHSWLLDEQLADYLPEETNIIRFQRRFRAAYRPPDNDDDIMAFVFGRTTSALDELPQRTTLERAIVAHRKAGHHWRGGAGWLLL
ncbi:MAG: acyltransferase domain-containing protein [Thermomicrobiales bacterium]